MKKVVSIILAFTMLAVFFVPAFATEGAYENTMNNRKDIVAIALSEVGYTESEDGNTKYSEYFEADKIAWNGIFVSWCAEMAEISKDIFPTIFNIEAGKHWFEDRGIFYSKDEYVPVAGDLVFYDKDADTVADTVALIVSTTENGFNAIEGNRYNKVELVEGVEFAADVISGYGVPEYEDNSIAGITDAELKIKKPSTQIIYYGDILMLQAEIDEMPEGAEFEWTVDNDVVTISNKLDKDVCRATSVLKGTATVTVRLVNAEGRPFVDSEGNEITDSYTFMSKVNFLWKFLSFFKNVFGMNRYIY